MAWVTPLCLVLGLLSGCSGIVYEMGSYSSLAKISKFQSDEVYKLEDISPNTISVSGIDILVWLFNTRTIREYNTSFIIPYRTWTPTKTGEYGMSNIGQQPFTIDIYLIADGNHAAFHPFTTALYLKNDYKPIYPSKVFNSGASTRCGERIRGVVASMKTPVTRESVSLANKFDLAESERKFKANWTCLELVFNIATPDPSERFRLEFGDIVTPDGTKIRPTIFFSPVTYKEYVH